jgi:Putative transposase
MEQHRQLSRHHNYRSFLGIFSGRYTHRVAISNHRLISFADGEVTFRWRDSAHHNEQRSLPLSGDEFLRRFLLHLLPEGFVRIRNFGSWPIADVPPPCHFVFNYSARHRKPSQKSPPPLPAIFGLAPKCGGG